MYFDEYGSRENHTVVLLHGAGVVDTFSRQYEALSGFHLVMPHLYGSGQETAEPYAPEKAITAVLEIIRGLGKDKVSLVGHSMGAQLAVALVSRHEALFDRAVFLSPWVCSTEKTAQMYARLAGVSAAAMRASRLVRLQAKYWGFTPEQTEFMAGYSRNITREQYAAWFTKRIYLDDLPGYASVHIPMLAVCGAKEVKEMIHSVEELGRRNPHCKTVILPGARHDFPMHNPETINPILLDFLHDADA
jgi:pimeloyl-ACP methyl ester carboxylesterase